MSSKRWTFILVAAFAASSCGPPSGSEELLQSVNEEELVAQQATRLRFYPRVWFTDRMVGAKIQGSNTSGTDGFVTLATITALPKMYAWNEIALTSTQRYRFLRYVSPAGGWGNVAELEFYSGSARLSGKGFGTSGSFKDQGNTFAKALDGNTETAFDAPFADGAYVGIDLGPQSTCVALTCASQGKTCGSIGNGCGGTLQCGTCASSQTCSAQNVCVSQCPAGGCDTGGAKVLKVRGRQLLDTCGQPLVIRGIEEFIFEWQRDRWIDPATKKIGPWPKAMAKTGANAVRILPVPLGSFSVAEIETVVSFFASNQMVVFIATGEAPDHKWLLRSDVKAMLERYKAWVILDAYQEATFDDETRWLSEARTGIKKVRDVGYKVPMTVIANQYGRDLTSLWAHGEALEQYDIEHNLILGWQAYWTPGGWYFGSYGKELGISNFEEAGAGLASKNFPIQMGIEYFTEGGVSDPMDYASAMASAQKYGLGWLWWCWNIDDSRLSQDGTFENLTPRGQAVINTDPNSFRNKAKKACVPTP